MRRIFGTKQPPVPAPTLEETSANLDGRGNRTDGKVDSLDATLAKYKEQIKRTRPGPAQDAIKRRALQVLKQKRMYEGQREQLYQQQFNLDQTKFTVDSIKDTLTTVKAMTAVSKEMKKAMKNNKELNIDYIDNMQDSMFDMMDMTREINEAMGRSYDVPEDVDENDLMAELDALEGDFSLEDTGAAPSYMQEPDLRDATTPADPAAAEAETHMPTVPAQRA